MKDKKKEGWFIIAGMLAFGFCGLFICKMIEMIFDAEPKFDDPSSPFYGVVIFFSTIWIVALAVLVPIQVLYFERKARKNKPPEKMTLGDVAGFPFGDSNPNAQVPKWITIPVKVFLWTLVGIFALFILGILISFICHFFLRQHHNFV